MKLNSIRPVLAASVLALPVVALGQLFKLDVGSYPLLPNTPNQWITLSVENINSVAHAVSGINVYIDVADGNGGGSPAPKITGFDLSVGPFNGFIIPPAPPNPTLPSKSLYTSTVVDGSHVNPGFPNGTVTFPLGVSPFIKLEITTVGFNSGSWPLKVTGVDGGVDLQFINAGGPSPAPIPTTYINGTISIVPEPETYAAGVGLGLLAFAGYRRFRR